MSQLLRARRILTEQGWLDDHQLRIESSAVAAIEPIPAGVTTRDAELLCPAYIDTHVHGGAGVDVMDDAPGVLDTTAMHKAREGVGAFLPTTVTAPLKAIHAALMRIARRSQSGGSGAQIPAAIWKDRTLRRRTKGRIRRSCSGSWISSSWTGWLTFHRARYGWWRSRQKNPARCRRFAILNSAGYA